MQAQTVYYTNYDVYGSPQTVTHDQYHFQYQPLTNESYKYQYQQTIHSSPSQYSYDYQDFSSPGMINSPHNVHFIPSFISNKEPNAYDYSDNQPKYVPSFSTYQLQQAPSTHHHPEDFRVDPFSHEHPINGVPQKQDTFCSFPNISTDLSEEQLVENSDFISYPKQPIKANLITVKQSTYPSSLPSSMSSVSSFSSMITPTASPPDSYSPHQQFKQFTPTQEQYEQIRLLKKNSISNLHSSPELTNHRVPKISSIGRINYKRAKSVPNIPRIGNKVGLHTTQPGPIPASKPEVQIDPTTGYELLTFSYSKQKIIKIFNISCPPVPLDVKALPEEFLLENCVYPRAMVPIEEYKGNRGKYERECNEIGWTLAWLNPEIRNHRGIIQRAVDSWRNTRSDKSLRSRRVRKSETKSNN